MKKFCFTGFSRNNITQWKILSQAAHQNTTVGVCVLISNSYNTGRRDLLTEPEGVVNKSNTF